MRLIGHGIDIIELARVASSLRSSPDDSWKPHLVKPSADWLGSRPSGRIPRGPPLRSAG